MIPRAASLSNSCGPLQFFSRQIAFRKTQNDQVTKCQSGVSVSRNNHQTYTQRNIFEILLKQTEIRLYLSCTDWFGTANGRVRLLFQLNWKLVKTFWFKFDEIRFWKDFSVCRNNHHNLNSTRNESYFFLACSWESFSDNSLFCLRTCWKKR